MLKGLCRRLKRRKTPLVLTVNGRRSSSFQAADSYLWKTAGTAWNAPRPLAAILKGMEQFERGKGIALGEAARDRAEDAGFFALKSLPAFATSTAIST